MVDQHRRETGRLTGRGQSGPVLELKDATGEREQSMEKISKAAARQRAVANVLASLRIEQLTPSTKLVEGLHTYLAGKTTADKLIADVMKRHVTVRRVG